MKYKELTVTSKAGKYRVVATVGRRMDDETGMVEEPLWEMFVDEVAVNGTTIEVDGTVTFDRLGGNADVHLSRGSGMEETEALHIEFGTGMQPIPVEQI